MTQQARPDWNAEMERQIKATESAQALVKDHEKTIQRQRDEISKLRAALENVRRVCEHSTAKPRLLLMPIHDLVTSALEKTP